jgi:hypothetical protein
MNRHGKVGINLHLQVEKLINSSVTTRVDAKVNYAMNNKTYEAISIHVYEQAFERLEDIVWNKIGFPIYDALKLKNKTYELNGFKK